MIRALALAVMLPAAALSTGCAHRSHPADATVQVSEPALQAAQATRTLSDEAIVHAVAQIGSPYRFGGTTPAGFDCSGLVLYSYRLAGIDLPRDTREQRRATRRIERSEVRSGDLLFFARGGREQALHVGLYVGDGEFVHAAYRGGSVRLERLDSPHWRRTFIEARRVDATDTAL